MTVSVDFPAYLIEIATYLLEWLSPRLFGYRHLSGAGNRALCRLGPASLLQPVPSATAHDVDHLAGDHRAGAADRACASPCSPNVAARGISMVVGASGRRHVGRIVTALDCVATRTGRVHRCSGACPCTADLRPGPSVFRRAHLAGGICRVHDRGTPVARAACILAPGCAAAIRAPGGTTVVRSIAPLAWRSLPLYRSICWHSVVRLWRRSATCSC